MYRRTIFILITVLLFDYPVFQFMAHQVSCTIYMMYMMSRQHMFEQKPQ